MQREDGCADDAMQQGMANTAALYQQATDQGDAKAQCNLGLLYELGNGVPQDTGGEYILFFIPYET